MGSNIHLKEKAVSLRKQGQSYNDIRKELGIASKGTLSLWFKDIKFSKKSRQLLEKNNKIAHERGLFLANRQRDARIKKENEEAYSMGKSLIHSISERELLLIGTSLYWGEGSKSERTKSTPLDFSNSDPLMVSVYMKFLRKILKVPEDRIRAGIHLYSSISTEKAREFWANVTGLPKNRFFIVNQISKSSQSKRPWNILPHGTIAIKVNSRIQFNKVKGMMHGIIEKINP